MQGYPWLASVPVDPADIAARLKALRQVGVPYSDEMIANVEIDLKAQIDPDSRPARELVRRYPKAKVLRSDKAPNLGPSERDALVAYLQILGQMVDFATFDASGPNLR
jgi:cytochrome c oxidase cbb3-type subunit II